VLVALTLSAVAVNGSSSLDLPAQPSHAHRRLLQDRNLAAPATNVRVPTAARARVPSTRSGSIQASGQRQNDPAQIAPAPAASATHARSVKWLYTIVLPPAAGLLLLTGIACFLLPCRKTAAATIGPWKTGLSGHLQKAFVTGSTTTFFAKSGCMLEILLYYYMQIRKHCKNQVLSCSLLILQ
jgi:hypothetical protein